MSFHHHEMVGAKLVAKRLKELRFDKATVQAVARLTELHLRFHGYGEGGWTDSAVRRYVTDAGPLLERLHRLTRSDCTTRNLRKAARLSAAYDDLEERIARLQEQEELDSVRPDLDGTQIMEILGLAPGPRGGRGVPVPARAADGARAARVPTWRARSCSPGGLRAPDHQQADVVLLVRSPTKRRDEAVAHRGSRRRRRAGREQLGGQGRDALAQAAVAPLDEPVGVQHEGRAGRHVDRSPRRRRGPAQPDRGRRALVQRVHLRRPASRSSGGGWPARA